MKNFFKYILAFFTILGILCRKLYHNIRGNKLTEKGERLRNYLYKVITQNYMPVSMADYDDEKAFNPNGLEGIERIKLAFVYFNALMEY